MVQDAHIGPRMQLVPPPPPPTLYDANLWCSCHADGLHPIIQLRASRQTERTETESRVETAAA
jgi:hypothetical protein